jgi:hypothetical protein
MLQCIMDGSKCPHVRMKEISPARYLRVAFSIHSTRKSSFPVFARSVRYADTVNRSLSLQVKRMTSLASVNWLPVARPFQQIMAPLHVPEGTARRTGCCADG